MSKQQQSKSLYIDGYTISDIATLLGVSRTTIYGYKKADCARGIDWDELRFIKATDSDDLARNEREFVALLISTFERTLDELNNSEPAARIEMLSKHINTYYKLKQQRDDPKVSKAEIAKQLLHKLSDIALAKNAHSVITFLSDHADELVSAVIRS